MSSSKEGDALSLRLQTIRNYYSEEHHIWDIGCDHGYLGFSLHSRSEVKTIHLVDPSEAVIKDLKNKNHLDSYITAGLVFVSQSCGQNLKIKEKSNCIFIAGMGGNEIGEIIDNLLPQLDSSSKLVISPHRKILELRSFLNKLPISLEKEEVISDEGQFYQILSLRPGNGKKTPLYGEAVWEGEVGNSYRRHQIKYFGEHRDLASKAYVHYLRELTD